MPLVLPPPWFCRLAHTATRWHTWWRSHGMSQNTLSCVSPRRTSEVSPTFWMVWLWTSSCTRIYRARSILCRSFWSTSVDTPGVQISCCRHRGRAQWGASHPRSHTPHTDKSYSSPGPRTAWTDWSHIAPTAWGWGSSHGGSPWRSPSFWLVWAGVFWEVCLTVGHCPRDGQQSVSGAWCLFHHACHLSIVFTDYLWLLGNAY